MIEETIKVRLEQEVPESAREDINDAIHDVLRENHDIQAEVVFWELADEHTPEP